MSNNNIEIELKDNTNYVNFSKSDRPNKKSTFSNSYRPELNSVSYYSNVEDNHHHSAHPTASTYQTQPHHHHHHNHNHHPSNPPQPDPAYRSHYQPHHNYRHQQAHQAHHSNPDHHRLPIINPLAYYNENNNNNHQLHFNSQEPEHQSTRQSRNRLDSQQSQPTDSQPNLADTDLPHVNIHSNDFLNENTSLINHPVNSNQTHQVNSQQSNKVQTSHPATNSSSQNQSHNFNKPNPANFYPNSYYQNNTYTAHHHPNSNYHPNDPHQQQETSSEKILSKYEKFKLWSSPRLLSFISLFLMILLTLSTFFIAKITDPVTDWIGYWWYIEWTLFVMSVISFFTTSLLDPGFYWGRWVLNYNSKKLFGPNFDTPKHRDKHRDNFISMHQNTKFKPLER